MLPTGPRGLQAYRPAHPAGQLGEAQCSLGQGDFLEEANPGKTVAVRCLVCGQGSVLEPARQP